MYFGSTLIEKPFLCFASNGHYAENVIKNKVDYVIDPEARVFYIKPLVEQIDKVLRAEYIDMC